MAFERRIRPANWRAAAGMLVFVLWSMLPAVSLALPERIECGMACCLDSGHCCCATRLAESEGLDVDDSSPETSVSRAQISQGCPSTCAGVSSLSQVLSSEGQRPLPVAWPAAESAPRLQAWASLAPRSPSSEPSSPRGPPRSLPRSN